MTLLWMHCSSASGKQASMQCVSKTIPTNVCDSVGLSSFSTAKGIPSCEQASVTFLKGRIA